METPATVVSPDDDGRSPLARRQSALIRLSHEIASAHDQSDEIVLGLRHAVPADAGGRTGEANS